MDGNSNLEGYQPSSGETGDDAAEMESGGGEEVCRAPSPSAIEQDGVFEEKVDQEPADIDVSEGRDTGAADGERGAGQDDGASMEITEVSVVQPGGGAGGDLESKVEGEEGFNFMDADSSDEEQDDGEGTQKVRLRASHILNNPLEPPLCWVRPTMVTVDHHSSS